VFLEAPSLAPIGSPLTFQIYAAPPPMPYLLELSVNGSTPGTPIPLPGSGTFPLNPPFLYGILGGLMPNTFQNFAGFTDAAGHATATLNVHDNPALAGIPISAAFILVDGGAPWGVGKISNAVQATITGHAPTITSVVPATGPTAGGWPVTISGGSFQSGAMVWFDDVAATNVVATPTTVTCLVPAGTLGPADVRVRNPDGNETTLPAAFTYVTTLTLASTTPVVATPGGVMTVSGGGFTPGLTATVGGVPVAISNIFPSTFSFTIPLGTFCSAPLVVTLLDGQVATMSVNPSPTVSAVIGPPGLPSGGSSAFVVGTGFHPGTTVTIGGVAAPIVNMTTTAILITAPPGSSGPASLVVTSAAGCSASTTYVYQ
jgi:hypothetical protein